MCFAAALFTPRYNAAPSQTQAVILNTHPQVIQSFVWGLWPKWWKHIAHRERPVTVWAETLRAKKTVARDVARQRGLVLTDSVYEWMKMEKRQRVRRSSPL
jgi:putative SOS response-associated peptidase YedK